MSQAFPPAPDQPELEPVPTAEPTVVPTVEATAKDGARARLARLVPRSRGARWAALGAAVVIVGGGAAVVAEHHHESENRGGGYSAEDRQGGHGQGHGQHQGKGRSRGEGQGKGEEGRRHGGPGTGDANTAHDAPAPLPALPAAQAAEKAAAAVPGGKVESLEVVGQQGGGSAWLAVVLGTDGVRHEVTLAGADGAVTGNTVTARTSTGNAMANR